jgi:hypothetical protein
VVPTGAGTFWQGYRPMVTIRNSGKRGLIFVETCGLPRSKVFVRKHARPINSANTVVSRGSYTEGNAGLSDFRSSIAGRRERSRSTGGLQLLRHRRFFLIHVAIVAYGQRDAIQQ